MSTTGLEAIWEYDSPVNMVYFTYNKYYVAQRDKKVHEGQQKTPFKQPKFNYLS